MKYVSTKKEIRDGYEVTSDIKKVWNIQMEMLDYIQHICKRHKIKYFADSGTLLGAVRDKGYIPWDDDIDIVMKRDDYNRFIRVANNELPDYLFLQTSYNDNDYFRTHAQMRNSNSTAILESEKNYNYKFNQGIFVDVFPLDEVVDNKLLFSIQMFRLKVLKFIILFGHQKNKFEKGKLLKNIILGTLIIPLICKLIILIFGKNKILKRFDKICSMYNGKKNKKISCFSFSFGADKHLWNIDDFSKSKDINFENMKIAIPIGFDNRLSREYGNYMEKVKAPTVHGEIFFDPDKSYTNYLK